MESASRGLFAVNDLPPRMYGVESARRLSRRRAATGRFENPIHRLMSGARQIYIGNPGQFRSKCRN